MSARVSTAVLLSTVLVASAASAVAEQQAVEQVPATEVPATGVPPLTDDDRAAAFPDVEGHSVHDSAVNYWVLFDQMEWQAADGRGVFNWDTKGWVGGDINRLWFRTEGDVEESGVEDAQAHVLYGRAISRWWDLVAGIRQDVQPGPGRTWAAFGIQGLAPYWFEIEATGYVGEGGRTHARVEAEYDLLFTNRLILQPLVEVELYGRSDPDRGIGAGFSTAEAGIRLRYEVRRELAPYVGFTWRRKLGGTADLGRSGGSEPGAGRVTFGFRTWF